MANVIERAFQFHTTDGAFAGDKAGGVVTGGAHDFHVAHRGGGVGGEVEAAIQRTDDDVAGGHQSLRLDADGAKAEQLKIDGGMVANNWLCQHLADVLNVPVLKPSQNEASAYGASVLAGVALGWFESLADVAFCAEAQEFLPQMSAEKRQQLLSGWQNALASVLA